MSDTPEILEDKLRRAVYTRPLGFLDNYINPVINPQELFESGKADSMRLEFDGKKLKVEVVLKNGRILKQ
jgi:hypothetical protein